MRRKRKNDVATLRAWARVELGMSRAEFDSHTPAEFDVVFRFWKARERRADIRIARLCYTLAQTSGAKHEDGSPLTIDDFLPGKKRREKSLFEQFVQAVGKERIWQDKA